MKFVFTKTKIPGLVIVEPEVGSDERGSYSESYKASEFLKAGIKDVFVQENRSISRRGVLRGLHYQRAPYGQAKLVRCGRGSMFEAVADLRPGSRTFGHTFAIELSDANGLMLYVPAGFAHGFYIINDGTEVIYKCSKEYNAGHAAGLRWNDPDLKIKWPTKSPILSEKDKALPFLKDIVK
ncbi:MAG: dTDP-4-dehydrorhamnose 3,5-epimerase [Elusimicrobia bacterium GWA2_61_42]|nr:MAG: dTDP-4-dehydrorhamnose 3,5-epimerase [Elusimicrobia bacterium GWA2_61_42]OGR76042.1 MAG: dTDP-4-dehydrorhamnose 3,5-epimerase [Elusimicrobia bacterium GWC2_61_25]